MAQSTIVVKVGGGEGVDLDAVSQSVAALVAQGQSLVLVHGGSHKTNVISERLGVPPRFVTSVSGHTSRYTDQATLDIFTMVYAGEVNKRIVERLQALGCNAVGLSGADGRLMTGPRKDAIKIVDEQGRRRVLRDDYTGRVERVNTELLGLLLDHGYTPVVCPPALSDGNELINVDGDRAAAAIAAALRADTLIILSNVPGLLKAFPDPASLVRRIPRAEVDDYMVYAEGRFKKKVLGAVEALGQGVRRVILGDSRVADPIGHALAGNGTVIE
jgi:[amino group carrier protein]-L-2-aminoadipate 6-kinase